MGADPLTLGLGLSAASSIYGAVAGNQANKKLQGQASENFDWQKQVYGEQQARNKRIEDMIIPYLSQSGQGIDALIGGRGGSDFNSGQDGLMQMMRRGVSDPTTTGVLRQISQGPNFDPAATAAYTTAASGDTRFDTSKLFDSIREQGLMDLNDQVSQLRGSAGSLGQRFGTAQIGNEAFLRARATTGMNTAYTQAGQSAWEAAQARRLAGAQGLDQQRQLGLNAQLGATGQLADIARTDATTRLGYGQLIGNLLGQKNQGTASLLSIIAGMNNGQTPQHQFP